MSNKYAEMVKEFIDTFNPTVKMSKLIAEEFTEWYNEFDADVYIEKHELKELCDLMYVTYGYANKANWELVIKESEIKTIKAQIPPARQHLLIIAATGEFLGSKNREWLENLSTAIVSYSKSKGWDLIEAFTRVHESNMSKLEDGKVKYREDGKVLKGKDYKPANLDDMVTKPKKEDKRRAAKAIKF